MFMSDATAATVKSADRVLDLLELLARRGQDMSHTDIGEALDIPKSSLSQLLRNLTTRGYLDYSAVSRGYRLGEAVAKLSGRASLGRNIVSIVEPVLTDITAMLNESSAFNQLNGVQSEVVATVSSSQRLVSHMRKGDLAPLYATSGGKAILAFMPDHEQEHYLNTVEFELITPNTIRSAKEMRKQIKTIRETGIAFVSEEFTPGIVGLAMPILSDEGHALGALSVAVPSVRFNEVVRQRILKGLNEGLIRIRRDLARSVA
jgi:DNA-binding IclR family transcriptional regulator